MLWKTAGLSATPAEPAGLAARRWLCRLLAVEHRSGLGELVVRSRTGGVQAGLVSQRFPLLARLVHALLERRSRSTAASLGEAGLGAGQVLLTRRRQASAHRSVDSRGVGTLFHGGIGRRSLGGIGRRGDVGRGGFGGLVTTGGHQHCKQCDSHQLVHCHSLAFNRKNGYFARSSTGCTDTDRAAVPPFSGHTAAAPPTISEISWVMAACRALL